jgi:Fur family ferric uptake transcriptional regulator
MDIEAAKNTLAAYLKENGLRTTKERFLLLDQIMHTSGHFDADELYASVTRKQLKISRATVYNTLDLLVNCGLISRYRFGENHAKFEKAFGRPRHDHLICLSCGDIIEFVSDRLERIQREVCEEKKFTQRSTTLQIFGTCSKCSAKLP